MTGRRGKTRQTWTIFAWTVALAAVGLGAGGYVFFHKRSGDWAVVCSSQIDRKVKTCTLSAPPGRLTNEPQNMMFVSEPAPDQFQVVLRIRDVVMPDHPAFLRIDSYKVHEAPVNNGAAVWQGEEAYRIAGEMRAGRAAVLRVQTIPDGMPRDTRVSLKGFRVALSAYRSAIRAHGLLGAK